MQHNHALDSNQLGGGGDARGVKLSDVGYGAHHDCHVTHLDDYVGTVVNRESIGLSAAEMVARWNEEHPNDPVMVAPRAGKTG